jgi:hypothetical protein
MRPALGFFLAGDLVAAVVAGALILAGQTALGIAAGAAVLVVVTVLGLRRVRR